MEDLLPLPKERLAADIGKAHPPLTFIPVATAASAAAVRATGVHKHSRIDDDGRIMKDDGLDASTHRAGGVVVITSGNTMWETVGF